ncbi:hypothetical protein PSU4_10390 [Pseudonocardia sulfidoxydans NBRC 16205]|uniref:Uncharacterized protein n=1 Tax=Pseudonocardia sulfidoxydans NBRC 16205 TaxID=1223511 RepID=A0A511DBA9_9PSEU|nr:hypothetical protein PSU4_10390 [Pseudonocardia sulfidoxydans NBRC 16205]
MPSAPTVTAPPLDPGGGARPGRPVTLTVWLAVAAVCVVAGIVLLVLDRRRRRPDPPAPPPDRDDEQNPEPGSLFRPNTPP